MKGLEESAGAASEAMREAESEREREIAVSRKVIRLSKTAISVIQRSGDPGRFIAEMEEELGKIRCVTQPALDSVCEYAEAVLLHCAVSGKPVPDYKEMGIPPGQWILGLCDCEGEIRRMIMTHLMKGELDPAAGLFGIMEEIHETVMSFDIPDALAPVRRKQDIVRGVMDKTRSDMLNAVCMDNFLKKL